MESLGRGCSPSPVLGVPAPSTEGWTQPFQLWATHVVTKSAQLCRELSWNPEHSFRLQAALLHTSEHGVRASSSLKAQSSRIHAWADTAVAECRKAQLPKSSRQKWRAQAKLAWLPHRQKKERLQVRLIRTIKGCQVPNGEPPLTSQSISCVGALLLPERRYQLFLKSLVLTA